MADYRYEYEYAHANGLGALLDIQLSPNSTKGCALGQLVTGPRHMTTGGRVHGGIIMALADATATYGTVLNLPPGCVTTTLESKTNFVAGAKPGLLVAEAVPVHIGRTTMVWQTTVRAENGRRLALVVQTQMVLRRRVAGRTGSNDPVSAT